MRVIKVARAFLIKKYAEKYRSELMALLPYVIAPIAINLAIMGVGHLAEIDLNRNQFYIPEAVINGAAHNAFLWKSNLQKNYRLLCINKLLSTPLASYKFKNYQDIEDSLTQLFPLAEQKKYLSDIL